MNRPADAEPSPGSAPARGAGLTVRRRLAGGFTLVLLILFAAALVGLERLQTQVRAIAGESSQALASAILAQVEREVGERLEAIRELALTTPEIETLLRSSNEATAASGTPEEIAATIAERDAAWRTYAAHPGTEPPELLLAIDGDPLSQLLRRKLAFVAQEAGYSVFGEIFVTDRYGVNVAQTGLTSDYRQNDEEWWLTAFAQGLWRGEVAFEESAGVYSLDLAVRVDGADGEPLGVLKAALDVRGIRRVIETFESSAAQKGTSFELYDARGARLYPDFVLTADDPRPELAPDEHVWIALHPRTGVEILRAEARSAAGEDAFALGWRGILSTPTAVVFAPIVELRRQLVTIGVIAVVLAALAVLAISLSITRPLAVAVATARRLAGGQLGMRVVPKGSGEVRELLAALAAMVANLRRTVAGLVAAAGHVGTLATDLGAAGRGLEKGAGNQSAAKDAGLAAAAEMGSSITAIKSSVGRMRDEVVESSAAVEEMTASIESVAGNARRLAADVEETRERMRRFAVSVESVAERARSVGEVSQQAVREAEGGGTAMARTTAGIVEIVATMEEIDAASVRLETASRRIDHVTEIIEGVARQTKLLALNAAIEAANAGEAGRGFAVVAGEVQRLAEGSAESTREIARLVTEVQAETGRAREMTRRGVSRAHEGRDLAEKAGSVLGRIVASVSAVSEAMAEISRLTGEQARLADGLVELYEAMLARTREVERATGEQTKGGERIRGVMAGLTRLAGEVNAAVGAHRRDAEGVDDAMAHIALVTAENAATARDLVRITSELEDEAEALRQVAAFFVTEEAPPT